MPRVVTIVAPDTLSEADIRQFVPAEAVTRLDHRAADIVVAADGGLQGEVQAAGFDCSVAQGPGRAKRLLICDMDSTIIEQECIDELARLAGVGDEIATITERAMRGELEFEEALKTRVARLSGLSSDLITGLLDDAITLSEGAVSLVRTMKDAGAYTALVSGGFTVFTGPVASWVGFDLHQGNRLSIAEGTLTGTVDPPILGQNAKRETLQRLCREQGLVPEDVVAIGDGANDLAMIGEAGLGIAYKAKPAVRRAADATIDHTDLTTALYFQGLVPVDGEAGC
ncbi:MAG: phosphoserine phosphatase SerB [Parvularcula sp.]